MTLFSQLNQARNEMNRKSKKVLGREMMTETMMCVQVLAHLPCRIWASSIELTKASFTAEKVEIALNKLFGDKSKKAIVGQNEPGSVTCINYVKKGTKKRKSHVNPVFKTDRDPTREGGSIFRTNIQAQPSKRTPSTVKKIVTVQYVVKKQKPTHEPPTDVEMDDEFKMSETDKSDSEMDNGECLLTFGQVDPMELGAA
ncbi:hypothetical protein PPTG_24024 [Phytophthora nicotianae INRA-310]|uniref:Uncharacterized protein n=1 Tax=Phytophthora nicotianae (strain INRA-310) TaxID=761204 RepID=W2PLC9_PHYN3|nr:hypothetical protein PPTG_24024 [Phytophthora nicotianae INRA-310]ETN01677.1 hypothetical protein PPTG_24024 [Phytophthora nicotianae INRA-310]